NPGEEDLRSLYRHPGLLLPLPSAPGSPSAAAPALTWIASSASHLNILIARAPSACTAPLPAQAVQLPRHKTQPSQHRHGLAATSAHISSSRLPSYFAREPHTSALNISSSTHYRQAPAAQQCWSSRPGRHLVIAASRSGRASACSIAPQALAPPAHSSSVLHTACCTYQPQIRFQALPGLLKREERKG
ncbi:hypothetical protein Taro_038026, partial [Colocasia esculenta]|nr:hypothetical protein [Colocasia esculenta]